jgi:formylglycine-generating enzyme required for sulfatase activity
MHSGHIRGRLPSGSGAPGYTTGITALAMILSIMACGGDTPDDASGAVADAGVGQVIDSVGRFVRIEPGTFTMGSPEGELGRQDDEIQHAVTLTRAFLLQATEVTQGEYSALMRGNPSAFTDCGVDCPVEQVRWFDATAYANAVSATEGLAPCYDASGEVVGGATVYDCEGYRLPTEAEWEYAARAGTTTATYRGNLSGDPFSCVRQANLDLIAWHCGNLGDMAQPVGGKQANAWGLYDMLGNVWEWTHDWYGEYGGPVTDPSGAASGSYRVVRGGSWGFLAVDARAAMRGYVDPDGGIFYRGFRLARTLP